MEEIERPLRLAKRLKGRSLHNRSGVTRRGGSCKRELFHFACHGDRSMAVSSLQKRYNHVRVYIQNERSLT
jgi:hypothetical protein